MGGLTVEILMQYLEKFPKDAELRTLIASPKERIFYAANEIGALEDTPFPVLCVVVGEAESMDEEMVRACEAEEGGADV